MIPATPAAGECRNHAHRPVLPRGAGAVMFVAAVLLFNVSARAQQPPSFYVTGYSIRAQLFPSTHMMTATARVDFTPNEELTSVNFQLNSALKVERVTDASGQSAEFERKGLNLKINLLQPAQADQSTFVTVLYGGTLSSPAGSPVEDLQLAYVGPEGSYLLYAGDWFPVRPPGLDRFKAKMVITVPADETVIASGESAAPEQQEGNATYSFNFDKPSFPGTVLAGNYKVIPSTATGANITFYMKPGQQAYVEDYGQAAENIIEYYSSKFGSLPSGHLAIAEIANDTVNAYSAPGLVVLASRSFTKPVDDRLLAHEIARQWWWCLLSPATANDAFLDQGLATYSTALYTENSAGEEAFEELMHNIAIDALTHEGSAPISEAGQLQPFTPDYDSIVYNKGAMIFHMLRWVIGDPAFFETLQNMVKDYAWKTVTIAEFQRLAEQASKKQLTYFFAQWVDSTGVPQFTQMWAVYKLQKGYQIVGKVQQDLDIFRMPVNIRVDQYGRPPINDKVEMVGTSANFTLNTPTYPYRITVDPGSHILKMDSHLKIDVLMARARQLVQEQAYFDAIKEYEKVVALNKNNSLAHYRLGTIYFLLQNYNAALEEMQAALNGDLKPKWIEVWAHLTEGKIFDAIGQRDRALNEYQRALQTNDNTQGALAEANRYIKKPYQAKSRQIS